MKPKSLRLAGFTLIELMVAIAILTILVTVALPSYQSHVQRTRRVDAKTFLLGMAQQLERCFSRFGSYGHGSCGVGAGPFSSTDGHYRIELINRTASTFTLSATPVGVQARDRECSAFILDHMGQADASGTLGSRCWDR